jgi:hypothetical protein
LKVKASLAWAEVSAGAVAKADQYKNTLGMGDGNGYIKENVLW